MVLLVSKSIIIAKGNYRKYDMKRYNLSKGWLPPLNKMRCAEAS